ncbi:MAG: hypothetical protein K0S97_824 [Chloroflexota bacterium]|jgi:uncharacterized protein YggT (Ycf19 family)|nr:hypothetical protein [Chloroflexota bacterium]
MTDYERTTTRETTTVDPAAPAAPGYAEPATQAASVRTTERTAVAPGPSGVTTASRVVTFLFGILQAALIIRIILLLLVANTGNDVVSLILNITDPFVEPFRGMFSLDSVTAGESKLDVAALVALIGWTLVEALILAALRIFSRRPSDAV